MKNRNKIISILICSCILLTFWGYRMGQEQVKAADMTENGHSLTLNNLFSTGVEVKPYDNGGKVYGNWWGESEICVYIENIPVEIIRGGYGVTAYIPDYSLKDGVYGIEVSLCKEKSPYSYYSYNDVKFFISNGKFDEEQSECVWRRIPTGYLVDLAAGYVQKENSDDYVVILKLHSSATGDNGCIYFGDLFFADAASGFAHVDLNNTNIKISAERLSTQEVVDVRLKELKAGLEVTNITGQLYVGETLKLQVKCANNSTKKLIYTSSDKRIATISKSGKIVTKKAGTTQITVADEISGAEFSWPLTIVEPYVAPQIEKNAVLLGNSYQFIGVGYGIENTNFTWSSSNKSVGKIGKKSGLFKALKEGTTKITLTDENSGKKYSFYVKVYDVAGRDLDSYISIETNELISVEIEQKVTKLLYEVYPDIFDYFADGVYEKVTCTFISMDGVAYTSGRDMYVSAEYINSNPQDLDCITHELIHCAQYYSTYDNVWLIEGITDYGRSLFGLYNDQANWKLATYMQGQNYTDSYQVTGGFLKYVVENHNKNMILILNKYLKKGSCPDSVWVDNTGYTIEELWELYKAN